jgi:MoaA/NifB/PqqE/SkfB family radical SAM enzyme
MARQWAKLADRVIRSNLGTLGHPYKLTFVVTKECHSRCVNCKIWRTRPQDELTLEEIRSFARQAPYFSWIDFTGGEPTDRPDFPEIVEAFLKTNPDLLLVHFPTNGLRPVQIEAVAKKIVNLKPPRLVITVSIDGPPKINDALRGIKGDFDLAVETFERLAELDRLEVYAGMTLYPKNVDLIDETFEAIRSRIPGFERRMLHVNIPHISEHYYNNASGDRGAITGRDLTETEYRRKLLQALDRYMKGRGRPLLKPFDWVEFLYQQKAKEYLATGATPLDCSALMSSCYLSENGTVYPCLIWDEPLGNIRETGYSLEPILRSPQAAELRRKILAKNCPNCWTPCEAYPTLAANLLHRQIKLYRPV